MSLIRTYSDVDVKLVNHMGSDLSIVEAARVSTIADGSLGQIYDEDSDPKLINYLMRMHHGTPFEHNSITFYIKAPIFVFREFHRHRIGWSYNEMSARYMELPPEFYLPDSRRALVNVGTSAKPEHVVGTSEQYEKFISETWEAYALAWHCYKQNLEAGITKELARIVLPVGIMSQMHATCNARSLMAFLMLRTNHPEATFPSHPQYEIQLVADKMEAEFAKLFPDTHAAFVKNGRTAP